jgi:hypothetical protein
MKVKKVMMNKINEEKKVKRYLVGGATLIPEPHEKGVWVTYEEAKRLYDVLKEIPIGRIPSALRLKVRNILAEWETGYDN